MATYYVTPLYVSAGYVGVGINMIPYYVELDYVAVDFAEVILAPGEYLVNGLIFTLTPKVTPGYEFVAEPLYTFEAT